MEKDFQINKNGNTYTTTTYTVPCDAWTSTSTCTVLPTNLKVTYYPADMYNAVSYGVSWQNTWENTWDGEAWVKVKESGCCQEPEKNAPISQDEEIESEVARLIADMDKN